MGSGLKLLIAGMIFGVVAFFAFVGVTKTLKPNASPETPQQTITLPTAPIDDTQNQNTSDTLSSTTDNTSTALDTEENTSKDDDFEIIGEKNDTEEDLLDPAKTTIEQETNTTTTDAPSTSDVVVSQPNDNMVQNTANTKGLEPNEAKEQMASLQVNAILASNNRPVKANIYVQKPNGQDVSRLTNTQSGTFSLPEGQYKITARFGDAVSVRNISLDQDQTLALTLSLEDPQKTPPVVSTGTMQVILKALGSDTAVKGNIYIQLPNGKHVTNQNYTDKAEFTLDPGTYKVTAKAPGKADLVRNLTITKGEAIRATFEMQSTTETQSHHSPAPSNIQPSSPPAPTNNASVNEGTINVRLQNTNGQARFIVRDPQGKIVARIRGVARTSFKLAPGVYEVIANQPRLLANKTITLAPKQTLNITFNDDDFFNYPRRDRNHQNNRNDLSFDDIGIIDFNEGSNTIRRAPNNQRPASNRVSNLQLHAVSGSDGRPLAVNFTVTTLRGALLGNYTNVADVNLTVPPQDVLVTINYETMRGQERITVRPNEPTTYTFTITPIEQQPADLGGMLIERVQEELRRRLQ